MTAVHEVQIKLQLKSPFPRVLKLQNRFYHYQEYSSSGVGGIKFGMIITGNFAIFISIQSVWGTLKDIQNPNTSRGSDDIVIPIQSTVQF